MLKLEPGAVFNGRYAFNTSIGQQRENVLKQMGNREKGIWFFKSRAQGHPLCPSVSSHV